MMMVMTISANAMSIKNAKSEAAYLSDKMAYELNLSRSQYEAVYDINLDYLMNINDHRDVYGSKWSRRNANLRYVLSDRQYDKYLALSHFYRPLSWNNNSWTFHFRTAHPIAKHMTVKHGHNNKHYRHHR